MDSRNADPWDSDAEEDDKESDTNIRACKNYPSAADQLMEIRGTFVEERDLDMVLGPLSRKPAADAFRFCLLARRIQIATIALFISVTGMSHLRTRNI